MIKWHIETRKLNELIEHEKNPRRMSTQEALHLQESLEKFGLIDKIIVNTDNKIIGGHARKKILKKLGIKTVECYVPERELTDDEVDELLIRLNRNTGDFDYDLLANCWEVEDLLAWGFTDTDLIGFADEDEQEEKKEKKKKNCPHCGKEI